MTGAGGVRAALRAPRRVDFFVDFFVVFFLAAALRLAAEVVCFFFAVWESEDMGATANAVKSITARALSFRYRIFSG